MREETVERVEASMDMVGVVCFSEELGAEDGGMKLFIRSEGGLGVFQIPLRDPGIFFGRVSFPLDQEGTGRRSSAMAYDLLYFVFFFSVDKVRGRCRKVPAMDFVFTIRR